METSNLRLECLKLAVESAGAKGTLDDVMSRAVTFEGYLLGIAPDSVLEQFVQLPSVEGQVNEDLPAFQRRLKLLSDMTQWS